MAQKKVKRHLGAEKADRQSKRRNLVNREIKKNLRLASRAVMDAARAKNTGDLDKRLQEACSALDKAARRGTIHWKSAARKKSRLIHSARAQAAVGAAA